MHELFKKALSSFSTGICVVSYQTKYGYNGLTVNAFSSLSLEPAKILCCIGRHGQCHQELEEVDRFAVSILNSEQKDLACKFARKVTKPNDQSVIEIDGLVTIRDSLATLICKKGNCYPEGDHDIVIGEVEKIVLADKAHAPLLYFRSEII